MLQKEHEEFIDLLKKMVDITSNNLVANVRLSSQDLSKLNDKQCHYYIKTCGEQFTVRYSDDTEQFQNQKTYRASEDVSKSSINISA